MDTFNFSFFEDKPGESPKDAEATSSPPASATPRSEVKPDSEAAPDDPFDFSSFEPSQNKADVADLNFDGPLESTDSLPGDDFGLPDSSGGFDLNEPRGDDNFPDLALAPSDLSPSTPLAAEFDDIDFRDENAAADFADLDFGAESSEAMTAKAGDAPTFDSADSFDLTDMAPLTANEAHSYSDLQPLTEPEPIIKPEPLSAPEIATVLPPIEPSEIRAAVEPAVFVTPAPAPAPPFPALKAEAEPEIENSETKPDEETPLALAPAPLSASTPEPATAAVAAASTPAAPVARQDRSKAKGARFLTADDPYGEVAPPRERLRVAIVGASGIGKNHARWFARHSCDVVSFLGSSDESVELTRAHLQAHMGFSGKGYMDLGRLLNETQPQAVCIASPPHLHYAQAMQCLEAGIHVLCEKPLVYASTRSKRENADGARELLKAASKRNLVLGTQLQYGAATPILCRLAGVSPFEVGDFAMEIETTNPKSPRDPKALWVDLAPHPLSVAQYLAGDGAEIVPETLQIMPSRSAYTSEVTARFGVRCDGGRLLMCRVIVRWFDKIVDNREPRRRFAFNGRVVQYSGVKSPDGTYIAQYVAPDGYISHYSDPVDYLIGNFVRTCWDEDQLILSAEQGVQNLDWLLVTADRL